MLTFEDIMDHARASPWQGALGDGTTSVCGRNALCGDQFTLVLDIEDGIVQQMRFDGAGCLVSQGCLSLLCEQVRGKSIAELRSTDAVTLLDFDYTQLTWNRQQCARLGYELLQRLLATLPNTEGQ